MNKQEGRWYLRNDERSWRLASRYCVHTCNRRHAYVHMRKQKQKEVRFFFLLEDDGFLINFLYPYDLPSFPKSRQETQNLARGP